jgi:hypothetical protein
MKLLIKLLAAEFRPHGEKIFCGNMFKSSRIVLQTQVLVFYEDFITKISWIGLA